MYKLFILILTIQSFALHAQPTENIIEYKGGRERFSVAFGKYLDKHKGMFSDGSQSDSARKINKFFTVLMEIDKDGFIGDNIIVNAYHDTTVLTVIASGLRETSGKWINHSGESKWVLLPIYYIYDDGSRQKDKMPLIKTDIFSRTNKTNLVYMEKFEVISFPGVQ